MTGAAEHVLVTGTSEGIGLALVEHLLADPHSARVFAGCRQPATASALQALDHGDGRLVIVPLDVTDERSIETAMAEIARHAPQLDLVINTAGVLHDADGLQPERRLADVQAKNLLHAFDVNALGTLRLARGAEALLRASESARFMSLSARVGSIGDNRLGGWYAYRASKAALNMLIRTLSIEWGRLRPPILCAALHPGTVATGLSAPFAANRGTPPFSPMEAAVNLRAVIDGLDIDRSGSFLAWDGTTIPW